MISGTNTQYLAWENLMRHHLQLAVMTQPAKVKTIQSSMIWKKQQHSFQDLFRALWRCVLNSSRCLLWRISIHLSFCETRLKQSVHKHCLLPLGFSLLCHWQQHRLHFWQGWTPGKKKWKYSRLTVTILYFRHVHIAAWHSNRSYVVGLLLRRPNFNYPSCFPALQTASRINSSQVPVTIVLDRWINNRPPKQWLSTD